VKQTDQVNIIYERYDLHALILSTILKVKLELLHVLRFFLGN